MLRLLAQVRANTEAAILLISHGITIVSQTCDRILVMYAGRIVKDLPAGVAVAEMERLGMLFDVSHLGAAGVDHVLELVTRPVIATHSSARALFDHHRNLTDAHLSGIAATGGVVCVNFFAPYLHESDHTVDQLVDHVEHVASVAGTDHVGIGPDFIKEVFADTIPPCCEPPVEGVPVDTYLPGLDGPTGLPLVTEALQRRGWPDDHIVAVLGENVLRLFRAELGRPIGHRTEPG